MKVHPRNYCDPKIAFCYEAPVKALENSGNEYYLTYYISLPSLKEKNVNFFVESEGCSIKNFKEDLDVEKDLILLYENEKSKAELEGLRAYRIELAVHNEQKNTVLDSIIQVNINDDYYSCMTHPIILNLEN